MACVVLGVCLYGGGREGLECIVSSYDSGFVARLIVDGIEDEIETLWCLRTVRLEFGNEVPCLGVEDR